jgi:AcrR family transcriptional regulator
MPPKTTLKPIIVAKAVPMFGERGLWGVTIDALAEAAGVAKGSIYRLCDSIEQLHEDALQQVTSLAQAQLSKILVGIKNRTETYSGPSYLSTRFLECLGKRVHRI